TREYKRDRDERLTEKQKDYGIINPDDYGGLMLGKDQALTLAIRRGMKDSKLAYWAVINGFEVELNVTVNKLLKKGDLNSISRYKLRCGFYTQAMMGVKGSVEIEEVNLVYDGGLGGKKK
ncbi:MAG: hypothetical protein L3J82_06620, partial [Planctomycetes bacterium]|nr:hypothetical protein [Planctomycetota bacterium]